MDTDDKDHKVLGFHRRATCDSQSHVDSSGAVKQSSGIDPAILNRLRQAASLHNISESSLIEIALAIFFARGDYEMVAVVLQELDATPRNRRSPT
jgi:hypothetical protein